MGVQAVQVPISIGELLDRLVILELKAQRILGEEQQRNIRTQLQLLQERFAEFKAAPDGLNALIEALRSVNGELWHIEDSIRKCEQEQKFDDEFIALARSVYLKNDERAAIKREINDLCGSQLREEKHYTPYSRSELASQPTYSFEQDLSNAYRHWNAGQLKQAEILCQKVLATWPGNTDALHLMGLMAHGCGNLDLALDYLRKACQSPHAQGLYFSNLAEMCRQKKILGEAEAMARRAVALAPQLVGGWNNLGIILQEIGNYPESLTYLERVVSLQPESALAYSNLGNTLKKTGQLDKARSCYMQAIALEPGYAEAHSNLSHLLKELGEFDEALAKAKEAIELNPRLADAYLNAAAVEIARQRPTEAQRWLRALLDFAPENTQALVAFKKATEIAA